MKFSLKTVASQISTTAFATLLIASGFFVSAPQAFAATAVTSFVSPSTDGFFFNTTTPTFTGTATSAHTITAVTSTVDSVSNNSATNTGSGFSTWSLQTSALSQGPHTIIVTSVDGHGGAAATRTFTIDTVVPTSTIASPVNNSSQAPTTVSLTGTSADTNLSTTQISVDGGAFQATSGTAASWTFSATSLSVGSHTFQTKATDLAGNTGLSSVVNVNITLDTTAPIIASHANVTAEATSNSGAVVSYTSPATSDNLDPAGTATCLPTSSSAFAIGTNLVTCNATDVAGNHAIPTTFNVIVQDTTTPIITLVGASTVGLAVGDSYTDLGATASDIVDGNLTSSIVTVNPVNTATPGVYVVTYNVSDAHSNSATQVIRTVTVSDLNGPVISGTPSNTTVEATSASGATVNYSQPTANDNVDGSVAVLCTPASGSTFAFGTTPIACTSTDSASNHSNSSFNVTVQDTTVPVITLTGSSTINLIIAASYTDAGATASDNIDGDITSHIVVAGDIVNTALAGTYVITYNVSDAHSNAAVQVARTVNVSAAPIVTHTLTYTASANGTITGSVSQTVNDGTSGTAVTAVANSGAHFVNWSDNSTANPRTDANVTANISVTANFALDPVFVPGGRGHGGSASVGQVLGAEAFNFSSDLKSGAQGADVTELQNRLTQEGFYSGPISGFFGPLTAKAVKAYQKKFGLSLTGTVGPLTRAQLNNNQVLGAQNTNNAATSAQAAVIKSQIANLLQQLIATLQAQVKTQQ